MADEDLKGRGREAQSGERASQGSAWSQREPQGQREGRRVDLRARPLPGHALQEQWTRLLAMAQEIREFIKGHGAELKAKPES
jgi:hypothetical protein